MAKTNIKGTSFLGLELEKDEEKALKKYLKVKDKKGKQVLRTLIRKLLKGEITL